MKIGKANISIEHQARNVTNGVDLDHNLDLWILKVKRDLDLWPHTWPWPWIFKFIFWNSCISEWEGRLTLHKGRGSRPFMTMTMTIWWPRLGVLIYQIVTGVTKVVGVPSTHLVFQGYQSNFKVTQGKNLPILTRIGCFQTNPSLNSQMVMKQIKWCTKLEVA